MTHPQIDAQRVEDMILQLGEIGRHSDTGVWRTAFSPDWVAANSLVAQWGRDAGLNVNYDTGGNLWAVAQGREAGPSIVTGSHIDSQCPGGRYDGALGIIAGMVAVSALYEQFGPPRRTLEVVSLCEEEGSRFPTAGFWGSRALVGQAAPEDCDAVCDANGVSIGAAMTEAGFDPTRIRETVREDITAFIELHIEQGPILEDADLPVAIVDAITHIRQTEVTLYGTSNHAGAFPMDIRNDPMAGFAEIASGVIGHAEALGRPAVTTIGHCVPNPGGRAIIPRSVTFSIDARHPDPKAAQAMYDAHLEMIQEVAARRGLTFDSTILLDHPACQSDPALLAALDRAAAKTEVPVMHMASGAGHDAQQMAQICPVAMLFVRSFEGRSHTPEEFSELSDCVAGIKVLAAALYDLAY
ncbi:Zn-dependent hydrolase [Tateyamaria sp. Alg231-49]|uniref:Zn-dependent hydrolase n=1 Tax=Tateyamaria sp. Alg231-49 TaxID=1922219 RepID=UPI000D553473|nr:Zn-dependent hydrolase [Tateyamaria sp. Alg231-49]